MNHTLSRIAVLCLIILFTVPGLAQDAPQEATVEALPVVIVGGDSVAEIPSNSVPTPVVIGGAILFSLVFLGLLYNLEKIAKVIAPLMKPEDAIALVTAALPTIMDVFMNTVATTIPTEIDDRAFIEAARQRGLTVVRDDVSGVYHTARTTAPATSIASAPPTYATTPTGNLPKDVTNLHELGGAGPVGGEGFR